MTVRWGIRNDNSINLTRQPDEGTARRKAARRAEQTRRAVHLYADAGSGWEYIEAVITDQPAA